MVELNFLAFSISKTHFIYFNTPLYNTPNINSFIFLGISFKYSFFFLNSYPLLFLYLILRLFLFSPILIANISLFSATHTCCHQPPPPIKKKNINKNPQPIANHHHHGRGEKKTPKNFKHKQEPTAHHWAKNTHTHTHNPNKTIVITTTITTSTTSHKTHHHHAHN